MPNTGSGRNSTITDQRLQIEKPMCSEKTEKKRFRRATFLPVDSQNCGSSGRQSSIHLPDLPAGRSGGAETVLCAIVVWVGWVGGGAVLGPRGVGGGWGGGGHGEHGRNGRFPGRRPRAELVFRFPHRG